MRKILSLFLAGVLAIGMVTPVSAVDTGRQMDDGLVLRYDFDGGDSEASGGMVQDDSANGNHAAVEGAVKVVGGLASFDGGYLKLPDNISSLSELSVSVWVRHSEVQNYARVFDFGGQNDKYYNVLILANNTVQSEIRPVNANGRPDAVLDSRKMLEPNRWMHIAATYKNGENVLYIDGVEVARNSLAHSPNEMGETHRNYIGRSHYTPPEMPNFNDPNFRGFMDNFSVYNRVLSAEEITVLKGEPSQATDQTIQGIQTISSALDAIDLGDLNNVTADLTFPGEKDGVKFTWSSDKPAVIDNTGKLIPVSEGIARVTLTVDADYQGIRLTRKLVATVYSPEASGKRDLIAEYDFSDVSNGVIKDQSGKGNDAVIEGNVKLVDGIALFDGGYARLPNDVTQSDALTVSSWMKRSAIQKNARLFDFGSGMDNYYSFQMLSNNGTADVEIRPKNQMNVVRGGAFPGLDEWVHVVSTYSKGSNVLYFNGVKVGENNGSQKTPKELGATSRNYIGKSQFSDPNFLGMLDNFKIYNRVLSDAEVFEVMKEDSQKDKGMDIYAVYSAVNELEIKGLDDVVSNLALPVETDSGVTLEWSSSHPEIIGNDGVFHGISEGEQDVVLSVRASKNSASYERSLTAKVRFRTPEQIVEQDMENLGVVTLIDVDKVFLPVSGKMGSTIAWSSSDPLVIAEDGTVTRPQSGEGAVYVDLTATLTYKGATKTKEFPQRMVMEEYKAYLMTYFGGEELKTNDEPTYATVHFAYSYDGTHWTPLNDNKTIVSATIKGRDDPSYGQDRNDVSLARDPLVFREQDGQMRLMSSHSWNNHDIYVWDKGDLTSFTGERILSVNTDKGNAWAPEAVYDPVKEKYMIIFTDPNMGSGSCGYGTYTDDFTQANVNLHKEQGLTNIPLMDLSKIGVRYIDCSMHYYNGTYYMPVRYWAGDATHNGVSLAKSDSLDAGSFKPLYEESIGDGNNEGPFIIKDFNRDRWYMYYDYPDSGSGEEWGMFGLSYTDNLDGGKWNRVPFDEYSMPYGVRHGNAIPITQNELDKLIDTWGAPDELEIAQLTSPELKATTGASFEDLGLPQTVETVLLDGSKVQLPVTWDSKNYQSKPGRYKVYGTFEETSGVTNPKNFRPFVTVTVGGYDNNGLIVDVDFESVSGAAANDRSGFGNSLDFVKDLELSEGVRGQAAVFDGSQYADMSKELMMNLQDTTISVWLKMDEKTTWARALDFGKGQANFINFIPCADDGKMRMEARVYSENRSIKPNMEFPLGEWAHIAMTMDPATQTGVLYLNGKEIGRSENFYYGPEHLGMSGKNQIGKSKFSDPNYKGAMDELKIFDRALSESEIEKLYRDENLTEFAVTVPDVDIAGKAGSEVRLPVRISNFPIDGAYKAIEGVMTIPPELEIVAVTDGGILQNAEFDAHLSPDGTLRYAFIATGENPLSFSGTGDNELINLTLRMKSDGTVGENLAVKTGKLLAKTSDSAVSTAYDVSNANASIRVVSDGDQLTATATELYTGDGVDLIPDGTKAVSVLFTGMDTPKDVQFGNVTLYYSPDRSKEKGQMIYVGMVDETVSLDEMNEIAGYTVSKDAAQEIMFGNTNNDSEVNAADALNVLSTWLRKDGFTPDDRMRLIMNVSCDARLDTTDAIAMVDYYVNKELFAVVTK